MHPSTCIPTSNDRVLCEALDTLYNTLPVTSGAVEACSLEQCIMPVCLALCRKVAILIPACLSTSAQSKIHKDVDERAVGEFESFDPNMIKHFQDEIKQARPSCPTSVSDSQRYLWMNGQIFP
ncbi:hypothetical protein ILYODFUR_035509 [Ilyodon furcidens]|uniref:Uncharacterized protein n=1 Tax=Ilyodon furcidens TaxID=33524 RepID=A0ABV0U0F8_9TELE